jgi:3'(2'), 5'-bisphosphate nucleotidase
LTVNIDMALVARVRDLTKRAGEEILKIYNTDFSVTIKDDASPVTEADALAEALILKTIRQEITDAYPIVAEESVAAGRIPDITGTPFWLVDPLDGTKEFVSRNGEFTVNIALIDGGRPALGVVHAPTMGITYWGSRHGAFMEENGETRPIACREPHADGLVVVASRSHRNPELEALIADLNVKESISAGSSLKFCLVAAGKADFYPRTGRTMEWDTAAGHGVLRFAGGEIRKMDGNELTYGKAGFENPHFIAKKSETPE